MIPRLIAALLVMVSPVFAGITIIPSVPRADEFTIVNNGGVLSAIGGGATVVANGTNGVPLTNAASVILIEAPTNAVVVHTVNGSTSRVAISATSDIEGPRGAPGAGNLQFYGNWVTNTAYGTNIIAVYGGQAYYTTHGVTSPTPPSADTTNWAIFAQAGSDGSNGTSGTNGLDGAGLVYRGTWAGGNLTSNDIVSYLGSSYVPLRNLTPSDQPDTSTNYTVFVARGTDGASGSVVSNLFFLGDWVISTVYPSNSVVGYGGRVYYANKTASNYVTLVPSINSDFTLLIDEGADGTDGDDGLNGVSLVYDNCYDASKVYVSNVVVTYPCSGKKNLYRATGASGPIVGVTPGSDASKWEEIISSGADADVQTFAFYSSYTTNIVYSNAWVKYVNGTVYYSLNTVPAGAGPLDTNYWAVVVTNGANGAAGASGTNGMNGVNGSAGPTNMQFMGSWIGGTFTTNQLVTWSGVTYFVNTASTTSRPPASGWDIFVDRGPEGPQGTNYTTYYTNVITYVYLTNQIVTNISYVTNTFNYTNVAYTSIITVVTNTYTATNVYASVEAYSDSVNGLRTSPSNSSVLQFCLTNGAGGGSVALLTNEVLAVRSAYGSYGWSAPTTPSGSTTNNNMTWYFDYTRDSLTGVVGRLALRTSSTNVQQTYYASAYFGLSSVESSLASIQVRWYAYEANVTNILRFSVPGGTTFYSLDLASAAAGVVVTNTISGTNAPFSGQRGWLVEGSWFATSPQATNWSAAAMPEIWKVVE